MSLCHFSVKVFCSGTIVLRMAWITAMQLGQVCVTSELLSVRFECGIVALQIRFLY